VNGVENMSKNSIPKSSTIPTRNIKNLLQNLFTTLNKRRLQAALWQKFKVNMNLF